MWQHRGLTCPSGLPGLGWGPCGRSFERKGCWDWGVWCDPTWRSHCTWRRTPHIQSHRTGKRMRDAEFTTQQTETTWLTAQIKHHQLKKISYWGEKIVYFTYRLMELTNLMFTDRASLKVPQVKFRYLISLFMKFHNLSETVRVCWWEWDAEDDGKMLRKKSWEPWDSEAGRRTLQAACSKGQN